MRCARLTGPRTVEIVDIPEPEAASGTVVVAIGSCSVSASDVEAFERGSIDPVSWFGHGWTGSVVAIGDGVRGRFEGERVVVGAPPACGRCSTCRAGHPGNCPEVVAAIVGADEWSSGHGGFAERIRVDARRVHRLPEGVPDEDAALVEAAAVAAHAVERSGLRVGDVVAVVGAGTIGLLVAEVARLAGAARVVAVDPDADRRELACELGADAAFNPGDGAAAWLDRTATGVGADVVFDAAGRPGSLADAVRLARRGGTVVAVSVASHDTAVVPALLLDRELDLKGSLGYRVGDVERVLTLMADDRLRVDRLRGVSLGLDGLAAALAEIADGRGAVGARRLVDPAR